MSRIASVKETGVELSPAEWERFERAVAAEVRARPSDKLEDRQAGPRFETETRDAPEDRARRDGARKS